MSNPQLEKARERVKKHKAVCCFSKKFPAGFDAVDNNCFATWNDYVKLERKYLKLFKRYQRELARK